MKLLLAVKGRRLVVVYSARAVALPGLLRSEEYCYQYSIHTLGGDTKHPPVPGAGPGLLKLYFDISLYQAEAMSSPKNVPSE